MNLHDLSQLYYLNSEINIDKERLKDLKNIILNEKDKKLSCSNDIKAEIDKLENDISKKLLQCICERRRLEKYISQIPDSLTRQIFTLRFIEGYSWRQVTQKIGWKNSEDNVRQICRRYIKQHRDKK